MSTSPFPSSHGGRAPTLAELQVELGADNANSLVSKIGELARAHGLGSHAGMNGTVDRVIGSLTMDERRLMSQGSYVPPRVDAIISAEAETAKAQQRQNEDAARRNGPQHNIIPLGKDAAMGRGGPLAALWNLAGGAGEKTSGTSTSGTASYAALNSRWDPSSGGAGLTQNNFGSTPFAGLGLDYSTTKSLFSRGFNSTQIQHAAQEARGLQLDPNRFAKPFAHLDKMAPKLRKERNHHFHGIDDNFGHVRDLE